MDNPSLIVLAEELSITTANNETLTLTGQGSIQKNIPGSTQIISWALYLLAMEPDQLLIIHFLTEGFC